MEEIKVEIGSDVEAANYNHQCYICDKIFSANSNLNRHLRKIHKENVQSPYNNVKCALCDSVYSSSSIYNQHLEKDHQVKIEVENLTFADKASFENWKHSVENETKSQYIKSRGEKKSKDVNKTYYSCNRSGYYVSKARTRKALKKQGSRKINGRCPASMNVTVNPDFTYQIRFVKTHVGHDFELRHLDLSDKDRELIVQKLVSGTTKKEIIKQLRSTIDADFRLHLATTKDIHNIINSKHLDSKLIRHNYDLNNVEAWISEMKEFGEVSSVLFYKSQTEMIDRFPNLKEDDFMLIIMKDCQSDILKTYGEKCVIIDSTHHVHCEYLHVALISVIGQDNKMYPVAFLFSTRTDFEVLEVFFTIIRDRVGTIQTRMVIADELNDFYQAWTQVMTRPTHNLLTPWSVFDNWAKKFELISNRDKLRRLKKSLRALLTETETDKFTRSLTNIIEDHKHDAEVSEFLKYFEDKFAKNPDLWSSCLRKTHGASNFQLWRMHDDFKTVYKEGKNSKKMCKYIMCLMSLFKDSQEEISPERQKALHNRHEKSIASSSLVYEVAVEPAYWLCPSDSSIEQNDLFYEVKQEKQVEKCCDLKCPTCLACRHDYKCTCLDYVVNLNMCKHIHRVCMMHKQ